MLLVVKPAFFGTIKVYLINDRYIVEFIFDADWYATVAKGVNTKKLDIADFSTKSVSYWVDTLKEMEELVEAVAEKCLEVKKQIDELKGIIEERLEEVLERVVNKK